VAANGAVAAYEIARNVHDGGILRRSSVPAGLEPHLGAAAIEETSAAARALGHIGVFTVEWFVIGGGGGGRGGGRLIANEIAPRVHNSGHWTQDAAMTSQFEQHIRAIAGWPLGDPSRTLAAVLDNLIGDDFLKLPPIAAEGRAKLHLSGTAERRAGRKMGHVNRLGRD
jgi:5-(carboxyamino)imidazole ribonucleotide synthase